MTETLLHLLHLLQNIDNNMIIRILYNKKAVTNLVTKSEIITNRFLRSRIVTNFFYTNASCKKVCYVVKRFAHRLFERFPHHVTNVTGFSRKSQDFFLDKKRI